MEERTVSALPGIPMILVMLLATGLDLWALGNAMWSTRSPRSARIPTIVGVLLVVCWRGFFVCNPTTVSCSSFSVGYTGTCRDAGAAMDQSLLCEAIGEPAGAQFRDRGSSR